MTQVYTSKEEYQEWLEHPTTKKYSELMKEVVKTQRIELGKRVKWTDEDSARAAVLHGIEQAWDLENFIEFVKDNA